MLKRKTQYNRILSIIDAREIVFLGHVKVKHGRRDGRDDVSGDHPCDGPAKTFRKGVCAPRYAEVRAQGPQQQAQASRDQIGDYGKYSLDL